MRRGELAARGRLVREAGLGLGRAGAAGRRDVLDAGDAGQVVSLGPAAGAALGGALALLLDAAGEDAEGDPRALHVDRHVAADRRTGAVAARALAVEHRLPALLGLDAEQALVRERQAHLPVGAAARAVVATELARRQVRVVAPEQGQCEGGCGEEVSESVHDYSSLIRQCLKRWAKLVQKIGLH